MHTPGGTGAPAHNHTHAHTRAHTHTTHTCGADGGAETDISTGRSNGGGGGGGGSLARVGDRACSSISTSWALRPPGDGGRVARSVVPATTVTDHGAVSDTSTTVTDHGALSGPCYDIVTDHGAVSDAGATQSQIMSCEWSLLRHSHRSWSCE